MLDTIGDNSPNVNENNHELEVPGIYESSLKVLSLFASAQPQPINKVYYPGCGPDNSPSAAFPTANVVYVDPEPNNTKQLHIRPQDALFQQTDEEYLAKHPNARYDVIYLLNSYAHPKKCSTTSCTERQYNYQ